MLETLVSGGTDPDALAELAKGRLRRKLPALRQALAGRFGAHHGLLVGEILAKLDYLDEVIERLSTEIDRVISPFAHQRNLLTTMPGVDRRTAEGLIAEIGVDMSVFGAAPRLASWAGRCPGQYESAGKSTSGRVRKGNKWLTTYLHDAALAAIRSKGSYLAAQYARVKGRRGHAKALGAVQHSMLVAAYHMLDRDQPYHDLGADYFQRRHTPERQAAKLIKQLKALGYQVTAEPPQAAA
jgi:transposase